MDNDEYRNQLLVRTKQFSIDIIRFIDGLSRGGTSGRIISDQLVRSATSIGANIVEAQAASSRKDFANFISHALKSANETRYWLELLLETRKGAEDSIRHLLNEATELSRMLGSSMLALRNRR